MTIDQSEYALKIVKHFGLENCKQVRMPLPTGYVPVLNEGEASAQQRTYYQSIIGSLLYLALGTRPDIAYAVISMSQFSANPSEEHIQQALYIVQYVSCTLNANITYRGALKEGFIAFADADWAGDKISCKSVTGFAILLAGGAVSWVSRKQKTVALSSTGAEYMAISDTCHQIIWIESLMQELSFPITNIDLCCDNQGAIFLASNPAQEHRSKHIDIRYHYIRECVEEKKVSLTYIPTTDQVADLMTKNLSYEKVKLFRQSLNITLDEVDSMRKTALMTCRETRQWLEEFKESKFNDFKERTHNKRKDVLSQVKSHKVRNDLTKIIQDLENYIDNLEGELNQLRW